MALSRSRSPVECLGMKVCTLLADHATLQYIRIYRMPMQELPSAYVNLLGSCHILLLVHFAGVAFSLTLIKTWLEGKEITL